LSATDVEFRSEILHVHVPSYLHLTPKRQLIVFKYDEIMVFDVTTERIRSLKMSEL